VPNEDAARMMPLIGVCVCRDAKFLFGIHASFLPT